jgi:hypothetical protein
MAKPEVIATQLVPPAAPAPACANAGTAKIEQNSTNNTKVIIFRICFLLMKLPPVGG